MSGPLSAADRARLLRRARAEARPETADGGHETGQIPIADPRHRRGPATFAQEQLWFLDQLLPGAPNYNVPFVFVLDGPLRATVLAAAFEELARRHDSLRTRLTLTDDGLHQEVRPPESAAVPFTVTDLRTGPHPERTARDRCREAAARPFDLTTAPLWRAELYRVADTRHVLVWVASHAVADGWTIGLVAGELDRLYRRAAGDEPAPEPAEPGAQILDVALWQRRRLDADRLAELEKYWHETLRDLPPLDFPYDRPRPNEPYAAGRTASFAIGDDLAAGLERTARDLGQTRFVVALAAYAALLAHYCGHTDIAVGTPVAGRDEPGAERVLGSLVNTVALRIDNSGDPTFAELADRVAAVTRGAMAHGDLPFGKLIERLRPPRADGYRPLLSTVFTFGSTPFTDGGTRLGDAGLSVVGVSNGTVRFDFELALDHDRDGLSGRLEYSTDLMTSSSALLLCRRYLALLTRAVADPDTRLSALRPGDAGAEGGPDDSPCVDDPRDVAEACVLHGGAPAQVSSGWVVRVPDPGRPGLALAQHVGTDDDRYVLGRAVRGVQAEIRDGNGAVKPPGTAGTLVLSGGDGEVTFPGRCARLPDGRFAMVSRLREHVPSAAPARGATPDTPVRDVVQRAWQELLGTDAADPDADFFEAGGYSMLGAQLVARLRDELRCDLSLIEFFQALTINELTALLADRVGSAALDGEEEAPISEDLLAEVQSMSDAEVQALLDELDASDGEPD